MGREEKNLGTYDIYDELHWIFRIFQITLAIFIQLTVTTLTFPFEVKIFINEHRNSEQIDLNVIILHKYSNYGKVLVINLSSSNS